MTIGSPFGALGKLFGLNQAKENADESSAQPGADDESASSQNDASVEAEEEQDMSDKAGTSAAGATPEQVAQAQADAATAATARATAVMKSEHFKGREDLAATLIAVPAMSAEQIIDALSKAPAKVDANTEATDLAAKLKEQNQQAANKNLTGGDDVQHDQKAIDTAWDKAISAVNKQFKRAA